LQLTDVSQRRRGSAAGAVPDLTTSRLRFVQAELKRERGSRVQIEIVLDCEGTAFFGEAEGIGLEAVELRLAAEATLAAIGKAIDADRFSLVGIKRLHAFDADVVLAVLKDSGDTGQRYVGAVPVRTTYVDGAAAAVLNATNRVLTPQQEP
jgi:hypothetical protein